MCIVIDANVFSCVFDKGNMDHDKFAPVFDWIYSGKGMIVYGGTKYLKEIPEKYRSVLLQFNKARKAKYIPSKEVDIEADRASKVIKHRDFDDQHLVGLLKVSGCKLICSLDARAYPYLQHPRFFGSARNRPKIYSSKRNVSLLNDGNIADVCKPCEVMSRRQREGINY